MIEQNKGEFDLSLFGVGGKQKKSSKKQIKEAKPETNRNTYKFPWGDEWLDVQNDGLFQEL